MTDSAMTMIDAVIEELKTHQTQLDMDGVMVGVSRQALEELLAHVAAPAHPAPIAGLEPVAFLHLSEGGDRDTSFLRSTNPYWKSQPLYSTAQLEAHAAEQVRPLVEALEGLIEAVELDADEGLEGIGSYTGARLTDAKNAIRARGQK
jgi:hypothetical protein